MTDERRQRALTELQRLGIDLEASQDDSVVKAPCPFDEDCIASGDNSVRIDLPSLSFACEHCNTSGSVEDFCAARAKIGPGARPHIVDAEFSEVKQAERALVKAEPKVLSLTPEQVHVPPPPPPPPPPKNTGERAIITLLALIFLGAGLAAATLSGFANYTAFSASVADPLQSGIWGWTGVIAAIISFGGFTFFYWHTANARMKEGLRALLFALAGGVTSIIGTEMYIASNNAAAEGAITEAASNRTVLEAQIADWRTQLAGIPADTRSVEGLEAYIAEVERVGRTHQKPYRDAQNELGLAKRRDDLQAKIEAANAELLGLGENGIAVSAEERPAIPSWFFAVMLEVFSSQGTSIGFVALLILYGRRRAAPEIGDRDVVG